MTTSTNPGEATELEEFQGLGDAAEAFLSSFKKDAETLSEEPDEKPESESEPEGSEEPETSEETPEDEGSDEQSDETDEQTDKKKYADSDDFYTKVKVGDQELEVSVKDLKRLYGQEAALTRKSQETSELRRATEEVARQYAAGLDFMLQRATGRANEFRQVNFLALAKDPNITAEQIGILQTEAQRAFEEERYLQQELGTFVQHVQGQQRQQLQQRAAETIKTLNDNTSPFYIEGWNQKLYEDIRNFATSEGLDAEIVNNLVDAPAFKLLHMAMSYKKGLSKVQTTKTNKTPKKIIKTSQTPPPPVHKSSKKNAAMKTLRSKQSVDAAADAFLASFAEDEF